VVRSANSNKSNNETLSGDELKAIAPLASTRSYPKHVVVVSEGDHTDSLYIVSRGRVKVYVADGSGREVVLNHAEPGEYFGELVLDGGARSASVMTLEPTTFLVVPKNRFEAFLDGSPEFSRHLIRKLIRRVRALTDNVKSLALMDVYGRMARLLLELAEEKDGVLVIENRPTQQEMASRIGSSREMISRIMKDLADGGYISVEGRRILVRKTLPKAW
jgi:CRP/FNR family cyclic AMP-dependent transcriptional regulator